MLYAFFNLFYEKELTHQVEYNRSKTMSKKTKTKIQPNVPRTVNLPAEYDVLIHRIARERLSSFASVVRIAVREYLRAEGHNVE